MSNIPSLEVLEADTIAEVTPINNNFEKLRVEVNDNDSRISKLKNETSSNLTSIQNQMAIDKEELLTNSNSKLDPNLESISASGKIKITSFLMPDYSKKITIATSSTSSGSTPYTVEKNGHIIGYTYNDNGSSYVSINSIEFHVGRQSNDGEIGNAFYFPVSKGDVISWRRTGTHNKLAMYFLPCIGEE